MTVCLAAGGFSAFDWGIVALILVGTTWLGHRLAGRQSSLRDFFLGGRRLPWYAVAASIAATEISAVTYISLPGEVAQTNMTYLQVVLIGSLITRALVGYWLVPAYYRREIYSPYDFVGHELGEGARRTTTGLFTLGGILGQSARVYMTAIVLEVLLADELGWIAAHTGLAPLTTAVLFFTLIAVVWTWMGGIAKVVWTDAILFLLFLVGIIVALATVHVNLEGGLGAAFEAGSRAGRTQWLSTSTRLAEPYTLWTAIALLSWGQLGAYGCDQLMTQRLFCCKDERDARRAILGSAVVGVVVIAAAFVGVALYGYFEANPSLGRVTELQDRTFPVFIDQVVAPGLKGLIIAGVFAAAISSLDSILAALSQTTLGVFGWDADEDKVLRRSRLLIVLWGGVLAAGAIGVNALHEEEKGNVLKLSLKLAGFTQGSLLAAFLLAFLPIRRRTRGLMIGAPISVVVVWRIWDTGALPWPWFAPIGCVTTLLVAFLVDRGRERRA
ncbi:MAG: hypothetical protein O2816_02175 [Planctomycetota bacterium]|nr:hypothetical protein [Planctomycetota bacterium]